MVRAYRQYKTFQGTEEELNAYLLEIQSDLLVQIINVNKLSSMEGHNEYGIEFHVSISTTNIIPESMDEPLEEDAVQDN